MRRRIKMATAGETHLVQHIVRPHVPLVQLGGTRKACCLPLGDLLRYQILELDRNTFMIVVIGTVVAARASKFRRA